jgi:hypothetical protein
VVVPSGTLPKLTLLGEAWSDPALAFSPTIWPPKQPLIVKGAQQENKIKTHERKNERSRPWLATHTRVCVPRQFSRGELSRAARAVAIASSNVTQEKMSRSNITITLEDLNCSYFFVHSPLTARNL